MLVSNFNNVNNVQGTGSTIMQVTPGGQASVFATVPSLGGACPGGIGLTTAELGAARALRLNAREPGVAAGRPSLR